MIVIAKQPVAGKVKTRLYPDLSYQQAADAAAAALRDTVRVASTVRAGRHLLAFDGDPTGWAPAPWSVVAQPAGGLAQRLMAAFAAAAPGPALLIGMDTPQVAQRQLNDFDPERYDACLGLAADGGYWAIGFREPTAHAGTIGGVAMSTSHTGADQLGALRRAGLRVQLLDELIDVDTFPDALQVAALDPRTAFARTIRGFIAGADWVGGSLPTPVSVAPSGSAAERVG